MESEEIIKSGVKELVLIPNECEVTSEDKRGCDMLVCENSPICDDHSETFSDSNNDDDISSDDNAFEDIEYVEASLPDPEIVSLEKENHEEEEVDLEDIFQIQDVILREKLLRIIRLIANIDFLGQDISFITTKISSPASISKSNSASGGSRRGRGNDGLSKSDASLSGKGMESSLSNASRKRMSPSES
uniref:Uncharacterized protein n=1 Tax=Tanacetum cinerariifolium TaxID=118510 RepID=A0A699QVV6_TANCI|nr:hypothetical protein [Tanacetum cinerariifolium]